MSKSLVCFFSASGNTKAVAKDLADVLKGDIYEILPEVPYTNADLNWMDKTSRTSVEMNNKLSRPEIIRNEPDLKKYDCIFLGFPIWWYVAPTIINTFLETYDFSNKKIILFATSGGSGFGGTVEYLKKSLPDSATVIEGKILNYGPSKADIKEWIDSLDL